MRTTGFTHVSINAHDLDESVRFYQELFGMEEVPAPEFPFPIRWLRAGDLQLHLVESEDTAPGVHHFGLEVDDFEAAYQKVRELGITYVRVGLLLERLRVAGRSGAALRARPFGEHGRDQLARCLDARSLRVRRDREGRPRRGRGAGHALPAASPIERDTHPSHFPKPPLPLIRHGLLVNLYQSRERRTDGCRERLGRELPARE
jgi:catechol 2,3-dioxygenase-like lactoylglutathione lyase family enzyme